LAMGSKFIKTLNENGTHIPTHAIIGDIGSVSAIMTGFLEPSGCSHSDLFQNFSSDGIVSTNSAKGGISKNTTFSGASHLGMGHTTDIVNASVSLLNGPITNFSTIPPFDISLNPLQSKSPQLQNLVVKNDISDFEKGSLTLSSESSSAKPGETVKISIVGKETPFTLAGLWGATVNIRGQYDFLGYLEPDQEEIDLVIPVESSEKKVFFLKYSLDPLRRDTKILVSNPLLLDIDLSDYSLTELNTDIAETTFLTEGENINFIVHGTFSDGQVRTITRPTSVRLLNGANADIIEITDNPALNGGIVVRGLKTGNATILLKYDDTEIERNFVVSPSSEIP